MVCKIYTAMDFENNSNDIQQLYSKLKTNATNGCKHFAILKLAIEDETLVANYTDRVEKHNAQFMNNILADSGFDVLVPHTIVFEKLFDSKFIDMKIKTEMFFCDIITNSINPCAFNVHPRSSISKTPLMLANHTGIIDSDIEAHLLVHLDVYHILNKILLLIIQLLLIHDCYKSVILYYAPYMSL